jgi:hypothetical protein
MNLTKKFIFCLLILFSAIFAYFWSLLLPAINWETDYGHLYYISMFNDSSKNLYVDFFSHKGPVTIFFIDIFKFFIGSGWKQSILVLSFSLFFFLIISIIVFFNLSSNYFVAVLTFFYSIFFFRFQGTNIYVDLLLNTFLFLVFYFFLKSLNITNIKLFKRNIVLTSIFLNFAILTRIDVLFYFFPIFLIILFFLINEKKLFLLSKITILQVVIFTLFIFLFFLNFYNYSLYDYINYNVIFNIEYSIDFRKFKNLNNLYSYLPNKLAIFALTIKIFYYYNNRKLFSKFLFFTLILLSILQIIFFSLKINIVIFFLCIFILEIFVVFLNFFTNNKYKEYILLAILFINFTSYFIFLYSGSYKLNHALILQTGSTFFLFFFLKSICDYKFKFRSHFFIILIFFFLDQNFKLFKSTYNEIKRNSLISYNNKFDSFFYDFKKIEDMEIIKFMNLNSVPIVCDRGWQHIFIEKESPGFMFDWWFYDDRKSIKSTTFDKFISNLKNKKYGEYFLIENGCLDKKEIFSQSPIIVNLIQKSKPVKEMNFFDLIYQLRKFN